MIYQLGGSQPLTAKGAMIDGAFRISGYFGHFTVAGKDQNAAAAMTHSTMAFDDPVKTIGFHLFFNI
jgi:hypothetical protein